ncbi:MAG: dihydrodipicolinate synthase family protein [Variovorax sp.]|nr:MAG: dihydrodipicolinate synthase family protein [Variovorax sp.]
MALTLTLPTADGSLSPYALRGSVPAKPPAGVKFNRIAYSAAHVVADPLAVVDPWLQAAVDWDTTIAYRQHLWSLGLGVAEAMDTAQRGMGLDWPTSLELIRRSLDAAKDVPGALVASGCGTDHLNLDEVKNVDDVIRGYEEQMAAIEKLGGKLIVMASRALARVAKSPADYERVYDRILSQAKQPVVLHWLGEMFDPALAGYWGTSNVDAAMDTAVGIIAAHPDKVDGIKISLLDKDKEIAMRRRLPSGVRMYTGDDFNYAELIAGDGQGSEPMHGQSDALLGIFDAMSTRSLQHFAELFRLADAANVLEKPELAVQRMKTLLAINGVE